MDLSSLKWVSSCSLSYVLEQLFLRKTKRVYANAEFSQASTVSGDVIIPSLLGNLMLNEFSQGPLD